jgi:hypothetical protein
MAFFGLTALGPQNSFAVSSSNYRNLQIFDEKDFKEAWWKINRDALHCPKTKIPLVMKALFHGPIPANEENHIKVAFDDEFETPETISLDLFLKIMNKLRNEAEHEEKSSEGKPSANCDFNSSSDLTESLRRSVTSRSREIKVKQTVPLTAAQEVFKF